MRTWIAGVAVVAWTAWSIDSQAQLQPPGPVQTPPGAVPAQPSIWGFPAAQPMGQPPPAPNATTQQLDAGDASGSFRGLEVAWVNVEAGGGYASMPSKIGYESPHAAGPAFGLGFGGRFITWTLGLRARVMPTSSFTLVQGMLEAGYHLPMGAWDPYVNIRGGYVAALISEKLDAGSANPVSLPNPHGVDLGLAVGDDYYLSALFSVGLDVSFDAMFLSHSALSTPLQDGAAATVPSASGIGIVVVGSLHAGLHFDL